MVSHDTVDKGGYAMANDEQIKIFLHEVKHADFITIKESGKNRETRLSLGITSQDQLEIIRNLKPEEYYRGPDTDRDSKYPGMVWIFKHQYWHNVLYIKLKEKCIVDGNSVIKCLSIHIDNLVI